MGKTKWMAALGITTMLFGSLLAGCGGGEKSEKANGGSKQGEKVEVTLAGWGGNPTEQKLLKQTLDDFEKNTLILRSSMKSLPTSIWMSSKPV